MDKKTNLIFKVILLLGIILALIVISIHYYKNEKKDLTTIAIHLVSGEHVNFNYDNGIYDDTISLELKLDRAYPNDAKIYYTLDGETPNDEATEYTEPILLEASEETKVYPVKVIVYYKGEHTETIDKTYVIGKNLADGSNLPIISLTTDKQNLYDEEEGLFVYDNLDKRGDNMLKGFHISYLRNDGALLIDQNVKAKLTGQESAYRSVKSFKVYVNKDFSDKLFYTYGEEISNFSIIESYKNIKLRSGGQDRKEGNVRNAVISRLSKESNFDCYANIEKAIVFLNGEYYGIFDIQENFSRSFLGKRFNISDNDNIVKTKGRDLEVLEKLEILDLFKADLNQKENIEKLEEKVDMDNYLLYSAIQLLTNNSDWPNNNITTWYYNGNEKDENNQYKDGRIRYLLYDLDLAYYTEENNPFDGWAVGVDKFYEIYENMNSFALVMNSDYYREKFITMISDLLNTSFASENILQVIKEEYCKIDAENKIHMDEEAYQHTLESIKDLEEVSYNQYKMLIKDIEDNYHVKDQYQLTLKNTEGATITWNNMILYSENTYTNNYYKDINIEFRAESNPGYTFEYWNIDGKKIYGNTLNLDDIIIDGDSVEIEAVCSQKDDTLIISEISAKSDSDWFRISNVGKNEVKLNEYYLTDDIKNLLKFRLPNISLQTNQFITINGKKNYFAIGDYICNFNLTEGETLYLYHKKTDTIVDLLKVPRMEKHESYGRYFNSAIFKYYNNSQNQRKKLKSN